MAESFPKGRKHWGKGEIACYEQFLLFQQCFQKTCTTDTQEQRLVWERVKPFSNLYECGRPQKMRIQFEFSTCRRLALLCVCVCVCVCVCAWGGGFRGGRKGLIMHPNDI